MANARNFSSLGLGLGVEGRGGQTLEEVLEGLNCCVYKFKACECVIHVDGVFGLTL